MPWLRDRVNPADAAKERLPLDRHAKLSDVYGGIRAIRNLLGGVASSVANTALVVSRTREACDANREELVRLHQDQKTLLRAVEGLTLELHALVDVTKP